MDLNLNIFQSEEFSEKHSEKLLDRVDTKFILNRENLNELLFEISSDYLILNFNGLNKITHQTDYYDTSDLSFYKMHHNKKNNRFKIRFRSYKESELTFLEFKKKVNGRTIKNRKKVSSNCPSQIKEFIENNDLLEDDLELKLKNSFKRITLINDDLSEKITIDHDIRFFKDNKNTKLDFAVVEIKQRSYNRNSPIFNALRSRYISPIPFSKYVIGISRFNKDLKFNRFKKINLRMEKII